LSAISTSSPTSVSAYFSDNTLFTGTQLIGCDGSRSHVRSLLCPSTHDNNVLPARLIGVTVAHPPILAMKMRALDPFFLQAGDPQTDVFFWFSFLSTPSSEDGGEGKYECQMLTGWPFRAGFRDRDTPTEIPAENRERLSLMKSFTEGWHEPFAEIVRSIPDGTEVKSIPLEDWVPHMEAWDNLDGRVTLVGDAAHAMTMCEIRPPAPSDLAKANESAAQSEARQQTTALWTSLSC
jgi:2-polyprenyl-6-methoxyphenol hydroxylase-like FAD-dependent oxidoreductase